VKIMALKFLRANGSGSTNDAVRCIDYAIAKGAKVMSNSWGGGGFSQALADAIGRAEQAGILFVAAAGNSATDNDADPHYPSSYENQNIISVLAVTPQDSISGFSCFGKNSVDLGAPGGEGKTGGNPKTEILSTVPGNKYEAWAGTSMATPHVAGAAALTWSSPDHKNKTALAIKHLLLSRARKVDGLSSRCVSGGTLDLSFLGGTPSPNPEPPLASFVVGNSTELALGGAFRLNGLTGQADYALSGAHFSTKLNFKGQATTSDGFAGWVYREDFPDPEQAFDFLFTEHAIGNVLYHRVYVRLSKDESQPFEFWFADTTVGTPAAAGQSKGQSFRHSVAARRKAIGAPPSSR
jgi:subtilisin family serine protease